MLPELQPSVFQAYHSQFNADDNRLLANMALLPLRTQYKGPAPRGSELLLCYPTMNLLYLGLLASVPDRLSPSPVLMSKEPVTEAI